MAALKQCIFRSDLYRRASGQGQIIFPNAIAAIDLVTQVAVLTSIVSLDE